MKQHGSLLLCLLLLLSGCSQLPVESGASLRDSGQQSTVSSAESPIAQTTEFRPADSEPTEAQKPGSAGITGSVTAGGIRVHIDDSKYRPYAPTPARYTRLREGALEKFVPSEDYGAVYPYVASRLFSSSEDGWSGEAGKSYGMMDAQGCILTDGIYQSVNLVSVYREDTQRRASFWVVTELLGEIHASETEGWIYGSAKSGVISLDGHMMLPCEWSRVELTEAGLICYQFSDTESDFTVTDFEGHTLFRKEDVCEDSQEWHLSYAEGLFLLESSQYEEEPYTTYWFVNSDGEKVLGPYPMASGFCEGLACVSTDGEHYGYIDQQGSWVIPPEYYTNSDFNDGLAVQQDAEGNQVVLDRTGTCIFSLSSTTLYSAPCGFMAWDYYTSSSQHAFYDREGNWLCNAEENMRQCLDADTFVRRDSNQVTLFRLKEQTELRLDGEDYGFQCGKMVLDGALCDGYYCFDNAQGQVIFVPQDLSAALPLEFEKAKNPDGGFYRDWYDQFQYYAGIVDEVTGDTWYFRWTGSEWVGLNERGETVTMPQAGCIYGDRIIVTQTNASTYYDLKGNLIFSYPLDAED